MENGLQKIKQPAPSINTSTQTTEYNGKKYKFVQGGNTGVLQAPKLSATPILDWVELKRKDNPRIKYKVTSKSYNIKNINTGAAVAIIACGFASLYKLFKK